VCVAGAGTVHVNSSVRTGESCAVYVSGYIGFFIAAEHEVGPSFAVGFAQACGVGGNDMAGFMDDCVTVFCLCYAGPKGDGYADLFGIGAGVCEAGCK
jgi:hypothetical protein